MQELEDIFLDPWRGKEPIQSAKLCLCVFILYDAHMVSMRASRYENDVRVAMFKATSLLQE